MKYRIKTLEEMPDSILNLAKTRPKNWSSVGLMDKYFGAVFDGSEVELKTVSSGFLYQDPIDGDSWSFSPDEYIIENDKIDHNINSILGKRVTLVYADETLTGIVIGKDETTKQYLVKRDDNIGWMLNDKDKEKYNVPEIYHKDYAWATQKPTISFLHELEPEEKIVKQSTIISTEQKNKKKSVVLDPLITIKTRVLI